jgi:DeoR/GlpR family transcriptional regulator of sugar metabolism
MQFMVVQSLGRKSPRTLHSLIRSQAQERAQRRDAAIKYLCRIDGFVTATSLADRLECSHSSASRMLVVCCVAGMIRNIDAGVKRPASAPLRFDLMKEWKP